MRGCVEKPLVEPDGWSEFSRLAAKRRELGFTQIQVAGAMGTSSSLVCNTEKGYRRVTPRFRERYAAALERLENAVKIRREALGS